MKKVVISCGPIPARVDSVKYITNRFKGGLAFKTAAKLIEAGFEVTIVKWTHTPLPIVNGVYGEFWMDGYAHIVSVDDVFAYDDWFKEHAAEYDAFVMAAAVANLTPSHPLEGKFPSHNYKVGEKFNIEFEIAPRAIDVIKQINPRACLIGYKLFDARDDDELAEIARHTLKDAKANIIFANTPATAKDRKLAVMADNTVLPCTFDEHVDLICRAIKAEFFRTEISPLTEEELTDPAIRQALATVKIYEPTFPGYGTVAIPVDAQAHRFATTARGHHGEPVLVRDVDFVKRIVYASEKATLNAPTLAAVLRSSPQNVMVIHRHDDDSLFQKRPFFDWKESSYLFPGTMEEVKHVKTFFSRTKEPDARLKLFGHGDIRRMRIQDVDWNRYYETFPDRYFSVPNKMKEIIDLHYGEETLEIGSNKDSCAKYAYDPFVKAENAINLNWQEVLAGHFDLIVAKNAINYLSKEELKALVKKAKHFVANTFLKAPEEKVVSGVEAAVLDQFTDEMSMIHHTLRLPDDTLMRHSFFAHTEEDYRELGFQIEKYGRNSALLTF